MIKKVLSLSLSLSFILGGFTNLEASNTSLASNSLELVEIVEHVTPNGVSYEYIWNDDKENQNINGAVNAENKNIVNVKSNFSKTRASSGKSLRTLKTNNLSKAEWVQSDKKFKNGYIRHRAAKDEGYNHDNEFLWWGRAESRYAGPHYTRVRMVNSIIPAIIGSDSGRVWNHNKNGGRTYAVTKEGVLIDSWSFALRSYWGFE